MRRFRVGAPPFLFRINYFSYRQNNNWHIAHDERLDTSAVRSLAPSQNSALVYHKIYAQSAQPGRIKVYLFQF